MTDSILSLMFPLHGIKKLILTTDDEPLNISKNDGQSLDYLANLSQRSFKKSLILFGEDNM